MPKIFFITGVCGVGKSSLIPYLKSYLSNKQFNIHDFDERGVPDNAGRKWRLNETKYWLNIGAINAKSGVTTIIVGFAKPDEIQNISTIKNVKVLFCLLDASPDVIKKRLSNRYITEESREKIKKVSGDTPESFIENNSTYASKLKKLCENWKCHIINTDNLSAKKVADRVAGWIKKAL